jgi:hypothetical protein
MGHVVSFRHQNPSCRICKGYTTFEWLPKFIYLVTVTWPYLSCKWSRLHVLICPVNGHTTFEWLPKSIYLVMVTRAYLSCKWSRLHDLIWLVNGHATFEWLPKFIYLVMVTWPYLSCKWSHDFRMVAQVYLSCNGHVTLFVM